WAGRFPREGDRTAKSLNLDVIVDARGVLASGSITIIDLDGGATRHVDVGLHPTGLALQGRRAYVANAMSDTFSEVDLDTASVVRVVPLRFEGERLIGAMPNALAVRGRTLYAADGGDNAIAEIDLDSGQVRGYRPAGYFPTAIQLSADGRTAFVLNTKGNGSVNRTSQGKAGNA